MSLPIKVRRSYTDGTERMQEFMITESQSTELLSLLGEAIGLGQDQRQDRLDGLVQSVSIDMTLWGPSGGYLENDVEQQQVDSAYTMTQNKKPLSEEQGKHSLGEHGTVQGEMVVSSSSVGRSNKAEQQADQRSPDNLEDQHRSCVPSVHQFYDVASASDIEQKELLVKSTPDSEGPHSQDAPFVTATMEVEQFPPTCHSPSSVHKAGETSRIIQHPESEGLKEKNEMNYKEVMLKQHSYLPKLIPPQVAEVVEKESKSEVPEIHYRDNGDSKTKAASSAKPTTPKVGAACSKAVTGLKKEAIDTCLAHLDKYMVELSEQDLLACIQHHLHPTEICNDVLHGQPCGNCGVSARQLDKVLAYIGVITDELQFGSSCGITGAVAEKHLEACRCPSDCFLGEVMGQNTNRQQYSEVEEQAGVLQHFEYSNEKECLHHLTDCQAGLAGTCHTCILFADTVKCHMQQCEEPCCYLTLLAASKIPSLKHFVQGRVIASALSASPLGMKLNCLESKCSNCTKLGQGGFGRVYSANIQGHSFAVKIQRQPFDRPDPLTCPVEKLWKLFNLRHPNVLREMAYVFKRSLQDSHSGSFGFQGTLVMKRYSGDLYYYQKKLSNSSALKEHTQAATDTDRLGIVQNLKNIMSTSRGAMEYCHSQGLVHLDIKGHNFLVHHTMDRQCNPFLCSCSTPCYCLLLADFDFTRVVHLPPNNEDRYLQPYYGHCGGTRYFMAPQRRRTIHGKLLVDPAEDRYSLGVMWAWMLMGDPNEDSTYKHKKERLHNDYQGVIQSQTWLISREYFDAGEILALVQSARRHSPVPIDDEIWNSVESYIQPLRCDRCDEGQPVPPIVQRH